MPVVYRHSHDGTVYPVYSGPAEKAAVQQYYLSNAGRYGYTRSQMAQLLSGKTLPLSAFQRRQIARQRETGCCGSMKVALSRVDPSSLKVGQTVPGMAIAPDRVTGYVPASSDGPARAFLSGGSVVYPQGQAHPNPVAFNLLCVAAGVVVLGLAVYARVRWHLAAHAGERAPITVSAPRGE